MKRLILLTFALFIIKISSAMLDSTKNNKKFREKLSYNMGGGMFFGQNFINVNLFPQVGYRITDKLTSGIGANVMWFSLNQRSQFIYGGNAFTRYQLNEMLFLQTEFQMLKDNFSNQFQPYWLAGGGYNINRYAYLSAYYLLIYPQNNNIYGRPFVIRGGLLF